MKSSKFITILILIGCIGCATPFINNGPIETFSINYNWDLNIISSPDSIFTIYQLSKNEVAIYSDLNFGNKDLEMAQKLNNSFIFRVKTYKELVGVLKTIIDRYDNTEIDLPCKAIIYSVTESNSSIVTTIYKGRTETEKLYEYLFRIQYIEETSRWSGKSASKNKTITCYLHGYAPRNIDIKYIKILYNDLLKCNIN